MTYRSRGRSIVEVAVAVTFLGFITGFVAVLCIGNYFRAKRAMERQKQRRLARLSGGGGGSSNGHEGVLDSPRSHYSGTSSQYSESHEQQHLLGCKGHSQILHRQNVAGGDGGASAPPPAPITLDASDFVGSKPQMIGSMDVDATYRTQQLNPQRRRRGQQRPFGEEETESLLLLEEDRKEMASSDVMSV